MPNRVIVRKADPGAERRTGWIALGLALAAVGCLLACVAAVRGPWGNARPGSPHYGFISAVAVGCGLVGMPLLWLLALNVGVRATGTWQGRTALAVSLALLVALLVVLRHG